MTSLLDHSNRLTELSTVGNQTPPPAPLTLYPIKSPAGPGWIGLHKRTIVWLSLGRIDRGTVRQYWKGRVREGKRCPLSARELANAARGQGSLELAPTGTPFQKQVWEQLLRIPFSTTRTYRQIATELGSPNRARAVGAAVGANPIAWLIPCHRVIPSNGGIGGYRWGPGTKQKLIDWEQSQDRVEPGHDLIPEEREKLEAVLLKAQRFEDIAKLAGDIAHDLNNLLAPIRMSTELLKRKLRDPSVARYVEIIETSTGRARSVIQEILSFSRETEDSQPTTVNVVPVLLELENMAKTSFPDRVRVKFRYESKAAQVRIDPTQFHRAILNTLVNARDAIRGPGSITVETRSQQLDVEVSVGGRSLLPGRFICISISDTGYGIPEEIREQIFDPFFTTKSKEEGTGLGLASVYGIIARAGGFIDVESCVGKGSTFHVFLPQTES